MQTNSAESKRTNPVTPTPAPIPALAALETPVSLSWPNVASDAGVSVPASVFVVSVVFVVDVAAVAVVGNEVKDPVFVVVDVVVIGDEVKVIVFVVVGCTFVAVFEVAAADETFRIKAIHSSWDMTSGVEAALQLSFMISYY